MSGIELFDIQEKLNHKDIKVRIDFIYDYDFQDNYIDYYEEYLLCKSYEENVEYSIAMIELAAFLKIKNKFLLDKYLSLLIGNCSYLIKLGVLDFLIDTYDLYKEYKADIICIKDMLSKRNYRIVKNQIVFNLMLLDYEKREYYFDYLLKSLNNTKDYRSHIRILNNIMLKEFVFLPRDFVMKIIYTIKREKYCKAVDAKLVEVENYFKL